jgi:hypothetical protein
MSKKHIRELLLMALQNELSKEDKNMDRIEHLIKQLSILN